MKILKSYTSVLVVLILLVSVTMAGATVKTVPLATNSPFRNGLDSCGGCTGGTSCCSGSCVNTSTSMTNCGSCGTTCVISCTAGVCYNG